MCQFKSAIVVKDAKEKGGFRLLLSPWTEHHSELIQIFKLNDTANAKLYFARVEFSPPSMDTAHLIDGYKLKIDEERTPDWFTDEIRERVTEKLRAYVKSIIVDDERELLIGGQFILAPGAKIGTAKEMVLNAVCGGMISEVCGGTISEVYGGTISAVCGGTISEFRGGTITKVWGGTITEIRGGTISEVCGGTITKVCGGTISEVRGGMISEVCGGTITKVCGGTISEVRGGMVSEIFDIYAPVIGKIYKDAKIQIDHRKK